MAAAVSAPAELPAAQDGQPGAAANVPPSVSTPSGTVDAQYASTLRSNIDSRTTAPKSVEYRLLKPHGEVRVNFMLDRSGRMLSAVLARSSGSALLDHHALEIVQEGHYPPFPGDAFPGESSHSFLVTLEFHA